ncbi:MAG: hypothetical protein KJ970_01995 [Candidatus Eisenbacteria bacterium]|uniref:Peptidase M1 membrane alanine aminopeptidase domain-containing protein n=1 Tax=Eiseniibacteriota bacterium TaxID=2212470 RepID=A0A948RU91_UNCEI|nr:hypothetical protein [Candidatus Eisenbacteria bacterium]MBU1948205.1 hypothetical protein [Candidatus Eisenbacteria bacterium]MBU2689668.1 hypothetical protein [Candidatus Eisenbacteria bacterium]
MRILLLLGWGLALSCFSTLADDPVQIRSHSLQVTLDPAAHHIQAIDTLRLAAPAGEVALYFHKGLVVREAAIRLRGTRGWIPLPAAAVRRESLEKGAKQGYANLNINNNLESGETRDLLVLRLDRAGSWDIRLNYEGEIYDDLETPAFSRMELADETSGIISAEGAFLTPGTCWYPHGEDELTPFRLDLSLPWPWKAMAEGRILSEEGDSTSGRSRTLFWEPRPMEGLHLVAGPYKVWDTDVDGIQLAVYLYEDDPDLAIGYLESLAGYAHQYNEMFGPYPFTKFAVVENFFPTGYGMPSFTLLGSQVLRLPFIRFTSLGHEYVHNWWGNSVYPDYKMGNWCEGITVFCADYEYAKLRGPDGGRDYRFQINRDYSAYVREDNDFPLTQFISRTTPDSRSIGYGKSAMVFIMLEELLGREAILETFRRVVQDYAFKYMTWEDWRREFEATSKRDLTDFFIQWVEQTGAPDLELAEVKLQSAGRSYQLTGVLRQKGKVFNLPVPLIVETVSGKQTKRIVDLEKRNATWDIELDEKPVSVTVDPDHYTFRRMPWEEMPPTLAWLMGDPDFTVVLPALPDPADSLLAAAYETLAQQLTRGEGGQVISAKSWKKASITGSILWLGYPGEAGIPEEFLKDQPVEAALSTSSLRLWEQEMGADFNMAIYIWRHPYDQEKVAAYLVAADAGALDSARRKIPHYGKYSYLAFQDGQNVLKGVWAVEDHPLRVMIP